MLASNKETYRQTWQRRWLGDENDISGSIFCYDQKISRSGWRRIVWNCIHCHGQHSRTSIVKSISFLDEENIDVPCSGALRFLLVA